MPTYVTGERALEAPINNVIVYPYCSNVRLDHEGELETYLSVMSTMSIDAGIELGLRNQNRKLTLPGETPFEDLANTTDLMGERATHAGIAEGALDGLYNLKDGRPLNNTYLQSQGIKEHTEANDQDLGNSIVVALDYHIARVYGAMAAFQATPRFAVTVESILHARDIRDYDKYLPVIAGLRRSEKLAKLMTPKILGLDKGQIPNLAVARKGARIVDIAQEPNGTLVLENDFAAAKRARLEAKATV